MKDNTNNMRNVAKDPFISEVFKKSPGDELIDKSDALNHCFRPMDDDRSEEKYK